MIRLADIIKENEQPFMEKYGRLLLPGHLNAMNAIKTCRSKLSLKMLVECSDARCGYKKLLLHSCGNRHCPHCQNHATQAWIDKQMQKLLPTTYFLITFTLPSQLRQITWYYQRIIYSFFFKCAWETIKTFAYNDKKLGGRAGAIAVMHTHSRELNVHPHIHIVMPAATINEKQGLWANKTGKYLFNEKALAKVFRAKMLQAFNDNNLSIPAQYPEDWIAHCKEVGKGHKALLYLGQYLYRGVISEKNIVSSKNGQVTFKYKNNKTNTWNFKTMPAVDFIWLIIRQVLPKGFRRARNFGFLHPNCKRLIRLIQYVYRITPAFGEAIKKQPKKITCPCCGAQMKIVQVALPSGFRLPIPKTA